MFASMPTETPTDHWLKVEEAAQLLKVSTRTIYNMVNANTLPALRVGNRIRIKRDDILNLGASE